MAMVVLGQDEAQQRRIKMAFHKPYVFGKGGDNRVALRSQPSFPAVELVVGLEQDP
jgi:hypothetical protein